MSDLKTTILREEKRFVLCTKPIGVSSQAENVKNKKSMIDVVANACNIPPESVFPVHRLDSEVGGVMVYAKNATAAKKLSSLVSERKMDKEYLAVVHGVPEKANDVLKDLLFKDSSKGKSFVVDKMRKGVKDASLEYSLVCSKEASPLGTLSLLHIKLHTGRTHQIRVQFSSRKLPLVGDRRYGSGNDGCPIALYSFKLAFEHPFVKKQKVEVSFMPQTDAFPWSLFENEISALNFGENYNDN